MGGKTWDATKGAPHRAAFRSLVEAGEASGVLALDGDTPIGWCAIGPRTRFPRVERSKALMRGWTPVTWSLNCLYVPTRWRGRGVATALVAAAIVLARQAGAHEIEAYPSAVAPGERPAGAFVWTGVPRLFLAAGFRPEHVPARGRGLDRLLLG